MHIILRLRLARRFAYFLNLLSLLDIVRAYYNQVISWVDEIHYSFNILMFDIARKIMDD